MQRLLFVFVLTLSFAAAQSPEQRFRFKEQVVDPAVGVGYAAISMATAALTSSAWAAARRT
jgi:glycerol uptake facilitator-like aquaporin